MVMKAACSRSMHHLFYYIFPELISLYLRTEHVLHYVGSHSWKYSFFSSIMKINISLSFFNFHNFKHKKSNSSLKLPFLKTFIDTVNEIIIIFLRPFSTPLIPFTIFPNEVVNSYRMNTAYVIAIPIPAPSDWLKPKPYMLILLVPPNKDALNTVTKMLFRRDTSFIFCNKVHDNW